MNLFGLRKPRPAVEQPPQRFVRGRGSWLWDAQGRASLDFHQAAGFNLLGHGHGGLIERVSGQVQQLADTGLATQAAIALAHELCQSTSSDQAALFDTPEAAFKAALQVARHWGQQNRGGAFGLIHVQGAGHAECLAPFSQVAQVAWNDLPALYAAVDAHTVAIVLEPVQCAEQVDPAHEHYLKGVARLCQDLGILLVLDERHTALGRCGYLLAEQHYGIRADISIVGRALGGGLPLAALLTRGNCGMYCPEGNAVGNALTASAGLGVLHHLLETGVMDSVRERGRELRDALVRLAARQGLGQVRGLGLLCAVELPEGRADELAAAARQEGLLVAAAGAFCLRLTPALTVSRGNIDDMIQRLDKALARYRGKR